jgi:hypothetical protein
MGFKENKVQKVIALLLISLATSVQAKNKCSIEAWPSATKETVAAIHGLICADVAQDSAIEFSRVSGNWARALVNRKTIYYFHKVDSAWKMVAKGDRFTISDWEHYGIPLGIR